MKNEKQKPVHEVRLGQVKAAIWANKTEKGTRYGVTACRIFKKNPDEKEWSTSATFGRDELLVLAKVLDQAHTWIHERGKKTE